MVRNSLSVAIIVLLFVACGQSRIREIGSLERPATNATIDEKVAFYVDRLGDKDYFEHYSTHEEIPSEWYVAAEELGTIGLPAIPALIDRLEESTEVYERQQIFYALRLAVQETNAQAIVGDDAPYSIEAFPPKEQHRELTTKWLEWWDYHRTAVLTNLDETTRNCVHGFVRSENGKPYAYANVTVVGMTKGAMTGQDGYFVINGVQPGVYQLRVMAMGYKHVTADSVVVDAEPGCGTLIEVELTDPIPSQVWD